MAASSSRNRGTYPAKRNSGSARAILSLSGCHGNILDTRMDAHFSVLLAFLLKSIIKFPFVIIVMHNGTFTHSY